jgi:xylulokinase
MNAIERRGLLLAIDIGTTRIKTVAIDGAGAGRAEASVPTPFAASAGGVELEVADLGRAVAEVIAALGPARDRIVAVGLAGMAESGAPLRAGLPTGPIIAWHDGRGEETVAALEHRFGPGLARWTGRRVRTVSSVAKLGWLLDHGLDPPDRWLGVPELALFLLTGAEATEHSLAARTGAYHVTERRWLPEVISHVTGAPAEGRDGLFPPVRVAGTLMGRVQDDAAPAYGLPAGIPVTIAGHDHLAAAAGLGAEPDDLFNSVGTAETLVRRLDAAPDVDRALELELAVTVWPGGDAWGVLASVARSGLVIEALTAHLGLEAGALDALAITAAGNGDGGGAGLVPLGQDVEVHPGAPAAMWAETLRALSARTAAAGERVAALAGPHRRLVVFGGGSRSSAWLRAKAEEVGVPVVRCSVAEAAARGAALAAGVAAGWWPTVAAGPVPPLEPMGGSPGTMEP